MVMEPRMSSASGGSKAVSAFHQHLFPSSMDRPHRQYTYTLPAIVAVTSKHMLETDGILQEGSLELANSTPWEKGAGVWIQGIGWIVSVIFNRTAVLYRHVSHI